MKIWIYEFYRIFRYFLDLFTCKKSQKGFIYSRDPHKADVAEPHETT